MHDTTTINATKRSYSYGHALCAHITWCCVWALAELCFDFYVMLYNNFMFKTYFATFSGKMSMAHRQPAESYDWLNAVKLRMSVW